MDAALIRDLRAGIAGGVLAPPDPGYDAARRVWNGRVDRRPVAIVRAQGAHDVSAALRIARAHGAPLAVRGTGHHVAGFGVRDDAVVIDLAALKRVSVDRRRRIARAEPGVTWGELDAACQRVGLATTGARISRVGIGGVTLGGGYGWLMRRHGLTIDSLRATEVIAADGRRLLAGAREHPDLFWALRGGGGNFGVVTGFEYALHPVGPLVTGGPVFYPQERAADVLGAFRALAESAPDELGLLLTFIRLPEAPFVPERLHGRPAVAIVVCHTGQLPAAERDLRPLERCAPVLLSRVAPMPYARVQRLFDAAGAHGNLVHGTAGQLAELDERVCEVVVEHAAGMTSSSSVVMLAALGGAVGRVDGAATAFSHRAARYAYSIDSVWTHAADGERHIAWTDAFATAMQPFRAGVYVNELGPGEGGARRAYAPATLERLRAIKRAYDRDNVFDWNHNVEPAQAAATSRSARRIASAIARQ